MAQEPAADVEIQRLVEPWSCVVFPHPAKLVGSHNGLAGGCFSPWGWDAFLVREVMLARVCRLSGRCAWCGFLAEGVMGGCRF